MKCDRTVNVGVLCASDFVGAVLCTRVCCGIANDIYPAAEVCLVVHIREPHVHGLFRHTQGTIRAHNGNARA